MVGLFRAVRDGDYSDALGEAVGNGTSFDAEGRLPASYGSNPTLRTISLDYDAADGYYGVIVTGTFNGLFAPSLSAGLYYSSETTATVRPYFDGLLIDWSDSEGPANILGGRRGDVLKGGSGDDVITGGAGNDTLSGGGGMDWAVFSGARANYTVTQASDGTLTLSDTTGTDGTDLLTGFEAFRFTDGTATLAQLLDPAAPISPLYTLTSGPAFVIEGGSVAFTLSRNTASSPDEIPITFTNRGASAADYTVTGLTNGNAVFAPGSLTASFTVATVVDAFYDPDERVTVALPSISTDPLGPGPLGILIQDSGPASSYSLTTQSLALPEGNAGKTDFTFTISRTRDAEAAQVISYAAVGTGANPVVDGFAARADYQGTVTFASGEMQKDITIRVTGDTAFGPDRQFILQIFGAYPSTFSTATAIGTVLNDDTPPPGTVPPVATEGSDNLIGTAGADRISLGLGNDTFAGSLGDDIAYGNLGDDLIYGNQGSDTIYGGQGDDRGYGGQGDDRLFGNAGNDVVYGNLGADIIYGNQGNDALFGGQGDDILYGGQGDDILVGGLGNNILSGGLGADRYVLGANPGGRELILGFNSAEGDRISLSGQSYTVASFPGGIALLLLSGGGIVELAGVRPDYVNADLFA